MSFSALSLRAATRCLAVKPARKVSRRLGSSLSALFWSKC